MTTSNADGNVQNDADQVPGPRDMSWSQHISATVKLGIPLIGGQLAQMAINTTDIVMLGWLSAKDLAAAILATQLIFILYLFGAGFANAVMPIAAAAEGQNDQRGVRRSVRMGLWILTIYALMCMGVLLFGEEFLLLAGQDPELAALAGDYLIVGQWGMIPALIYLGVRSFLSALERAAMVLWSGLAAIIVNALVNYALIFGNWGAPKLGIVGAAWASVLSSTVLALILIVQVLVSKRFQPYEIFVRFWRPDWPAFVEIFRLGLPIGITIVAEVGLFAAAALMMGWIGTLQLAAHGIALQITAISFMLPLGLSLAASVRIGQAYGRHDQVGLSRAATTVIAMSGGIALIAAIIFWFFPEPLIGLFLDEGNPDAEDLLRIGVPMLAVAAAFQLGDAMQAVGSGLLRGLKDTRVPMMIALFSYWPVGLASGYVLAFPLGMGGIGIWIGLALGLTVASVLMLWRFARREQYGLI